MRLPGLQALFHGIQTHHRQLPLPIRVQSLECASIILMQGVNVKVAQEHLGHKDISTTMNIYSHVLPSVAKEAAQKIGALVYEAG